MGEKAGEEELEGGEEERVKGERGERGEYVVKEDEISSSTCSIIL